MAYNGSALINRQCRILLTFAGRKPHVVRALRRSERFRWVGAVDADPNALVKETASFFEAVPEVKETERYIDSLERLCRRHRVDCIAPLNDRDIVLLAEHAERLLASGTRLLSVTVELARVFEDKHAAAQWLRAHNLEAPETRLPSDLRPRDGRWVCKARLGQGSAGYHVLEPPGTPPPSDDLVLQPYLHGEQFVLDVLADNRGFVTVIPKRRLAELHGDMICGQHVDDAALVALGMQLAKASHLTGALDVDVIRCDGKDNVIDVNPRLGGGFEFTAAIAPGYVDALAAIGLGEPPSPVRVVERGSVYGDHSYHTARAETRE